MLWQILNFLRQELENYTLEAVTILALIWFRRLKIIDQDLETIKI